jgi:hypothetical protein
MNNNSDLKTSTFDLKKDFEAKQKKYEYEVLKKNQNNLFNNIEYKTQLLNIDSRFRNKIPKNIYTTTNDILPNNPIKVIKDSNIVQINYPNHPFSIGDSIIIQNVVGKSKILTNCVYFFDDFPYMIINYENHNIHLDYLLHYEKYQIQISIINDIGMNTKYNNIPINMVTGIFNITLPSIVNNVTEITPQILKFFNVNTAFDMDNDFFLIKLSYSYVALSGFYYAPTDVFKFSFLNIGGIPIEYINANYPIDYNKFHSNQQITNIDNNNIYFISDIIASSTVAGGSNNVQVMLITNTLGGYPDANNYTINLKKTLNNVVRIELVSTEFPYIDFLVKLNVNNKLYWKQFDDGTYIYQASIPEGNYDGPNLISTINTVLNNVPRMGSTVENPIYNIFTVTMDTYTQKIIFTAYKNNNLPNSLSASLITIDNIVYILLTVQHPGNLVEVNEKVEISGAAKIGTIIDAVYINKTQTIYQINTTNQTYTILLAPLKQITNATTIDLTGNGGPGTVIKTKAKVSFLFNYSDTLGHILGFKNVGQPNAITPYSSQITNTDLYIQSTNLNEVGIADNTSSILNLSGNNYYILMYINDYECVINNSNQLSSFAKILLSGNPGDVLFNTFVNYPLEFDFPIVTLTELNIKFTYPDGTLVDFRNIDHSFTLRVIEKTGTPYKTGLNSKDSSFYEMVKDQNIKSI